MINPLDKLAARWLYAYANPVQVFSLYLIMDFYLEAIWLLAAPT